MPSVTQPSKNSNHMTPSQGWQEDVPVDGTVELPPDRRALDGLGRNHSLRTALADLVDNSIDAEASHVLIRFVRKHGRLRGLYVVDNGKGMTTEAINVAMTLGGRREYAEKDLGSFGIGLKAASFSNAKLVTVLSCAAGHAPVGRVWKPILTSVVSNATLSPRRSPSRSCPAGGAFPGPGREPSYVGTMSSGSQPRTTPPVWRSSSAGR